MKKVALLISFFSTLAVSGQACGSATSNAKTEEALNLPELSVMASSSAKTEEALNLPEPSVMANASVSPTSNSSVSSVINSVSPATNKQPGRAISNPPAPQTNGNSVSSVINSAAPQTNRPVSSTTSTPAVQTNNRPVSSIVSQVTKPESGQQVDPTLLAAQAAMDGEDYPKATQLFQQYLSRYPNDNNATIQLIRLYSLQENYGAAVNLLSIYAAKFGQDRLYLKERARYLVLTNQPQAALAILGPLLQQDPTNSELLEIKNYALTHKPEPIPLGQDPVLTAAINAANNNDNPKAITLYIQYLNKNPNDKDAMLSLIRLQSLQENYTAANKLLTYYQSKFGQDDAFLKEKARYFTLTNQPKLAWSILGPLLQKYPKSTELASIQQYLIQHGAAAQATTVGQIVQPTQPGQPTVTPPMPQPATGVALPPSNVATPSSTSIELPPPSVAIPAPAPLQEAAPQDLTLAAAQTAMQNNNSKKAIELYQQYLARNPNDKTAILTLISLYSMAENYTAANNLLNDYGRRFGQDSGYLTEKARFFALQNQSKAALNILEPLLNKDPTNETLLDIKKYALTHKEEATGAGAAQVAQDPLLVAAQKAFDQKKSKQGLSLYQEYLAKHPEDKAVYIQVIQNLLWAEQYSLALKFMAEYEKRFSSDDALLTEKARYFSLNDKPKESLAILQPLLKKNPNDKTLLEIKKYALTHKAQAAGAQGNGEEEIDAKSYAAAAEVSLREGDSKRAFYFISQALENDDKNKQYQCLRKKIINRILKYDLCHDKLDPKFVLKLARTLAELGCLDVPANLYKTYLCKWSYDPKPWLEWAYIESWRGDSRAAIKVLNSYCKLFGPTDEYQIVKANVLASANRPCAALRITEPLLPYKYKDYDYNYARTTALYYGNRPIQMFRNLDVLNMIEPNTEQTLGLNDFLYADFRDRITADAYHSFDTDTIRITWSRLTGQYFYSPITSILADYTTERISADENTGLNPISGGEALLINGFRAGGTHRFNPYVYLRGLVGVQDATKGGGTEFAYSVDLLTRPSDPLEIDFLFRRSFYDQSARTVSLGIIQALNQVTFTWEPMIQTYLVGTAYYASYSDGNSEEYFEINPSTYVLANELVNVTVGLDIIFDNFKKQLDHGYYDPSDYKLYAVNTSITFKQSENINYVLIVSLGRQKDETFTSFAKANDYSAQAYFGIYQDWYLTLTANATSRGRSLLNDNQGKYEVYSFTASLTRRF